jgi:LuxR family maltose regulon positive regulatory protein
VLEIHQDDLRFTVKETAEFLGTIMGLDLSQEEVSALEQRTEGWIAGLQLAALSMQGRDDLPGFIQAFTGSNRFILDYLVEEVFERQSDEIKDFLLKTSILEQLSGSLCNEVTRKTNSQELLETLEQSNLFIIPLDQSRQWYRYHRLFGDLLRHKLQISGLPEKELHQRARGWFEANDLMDSAVQHALQAQDWEIAGSLMQVASTDFLKRGEVLTVIGWFQSLPEESFKANPKLCLDYAWPLLLSTQYDAAVPLLDQAEKAAQDIPPFLGEVHAARAYLARGVGDHESMVERSQSALKLLPKTSIDSRGIVAVNLGLAYWHMGKMQDAEAALNEALEAGQATGNHYAALTALIFLGRVLGVRGQLHQAKEYFERAIQQGEGIPINALAYMDLATLYYEWNMLDECDTYIQKAINLCKQSRNFEFLVGSLLIQSRLRIAQGDLAGAEKALDQAWVLVRGGEIPASTAKRMEVAQVRLLLAKGESLEDWTQNLTESIDCHSFYRFLGVTKARTLPEPESAAYLEGLSKVAKANEWVYGLVNVCALQAALFGLDKGTFNILADILPQAESGGFIRSFVDVGEKLIPALREAIQQDVATGYVTRVLDSITGEIDSEKADQSSLIEPLSERELEVLKLITSGMSNREIAETLVISTGTAKTHVHNLCGKLGVRNRTEAAMKAKELNLI